MAVVVSLLVHALLLAFLRVPTPPERFVVTNLVAEPGGEEPPVAEESEVLPAPAPSERPASPVAAPERVRVVEAARPPEPEREREPEEEPDPVPQRNEYERLPSVAQPDRDMPAPEEATALAEFDNSTDQETMARDTSLDEVSAVPEAARTDAPEDDRGERAAEQPARDAEAETEPARSPSAPDEEGPAEVVAEQGGGASAEEPSESARSADSPAVAEPSEPTPAVDEPNDMPEQDVEVAAEAEATLAPLRPSAAIATARSRAEAADADGGQTVRRENPGVDREAYVEVFGSRDDRERAAVASSAASSSAFGDHSGRWERTRAALENFDVHVRPGTETSLNTRSDAVAGYIHYLHNKIHEPWWRYLAHLDLYVGAADGLADQSLMALLEFAVTREGDVADVRIVDGSGQLNFDMTAVDLLYEIGPHRPPPPGMLSSDGRAYVRWSFHRDQRGCGTFGASAHRVATGPTDAP
jgi:TonB family protein